MKVSVVCASNQNRSMEAHALLLKKGVAEVCSYGTNTMIKVPGATPTTPNTFSFGTTYMQIAKELEKKDAALYRQNGLLMLMERNASIKPAPQRFQDRVLVDEDVIVTCEERCFDIVSEDLLQRSSASSGAGVPDDTKQAANAAPRKTIHLVNFDIIDSPEEATVGSRAILQFLQGVVDRQRKAKRMQLALDFDGAVVQSYEELAASSPAGDSAIRTLYSMHYL